MNRLWTIPAALPRGRERRYAVLACLLCLVPAALIALFPGWLLDRL